MDSKQRTVCIYCGANEGNSSEILLQSKILAEDLARMGFDLVYGGGKDGLMLLVADIFMAHGRKVIGIRPEKLVKDEELHTGISEIEIVPNMYIRKSRMIELSDILIALPGGIGTLDELMDAFTETKLGFVNKQILVLNVDDYYAGLMTMIGNMVDNGFLKKEDSKLLNFSSSPIGILKKLETFYPQTAKEIDKLALIEIQKGRILTTLSKGKSSYYIPGGKRDIGETDKEALIREVKEELTVELNPSSIKYTGTYRAQADGKQDGVMVKMTCYSADYQGDLKADNEIAEIRWMTYADRDKVSHVDKIIFDDLKDKGIL
ncbi:MAG: TIGR00730 family Rossman fold protein [Saprospiraceae bacterium]|nr:TIGR00730 family Rossman fold protein [Saprospiraceae bacterium]